jgi:ABC-2 type transport system permease protein
VGVMGRVRESLRRTRFLIWKEFLELRRDPRLIAVVVVAPILQLIMLGYAATTDVRNVPVVIADADRSPASRRLIDQFESSRYFAITRVVTTVDEIGSDLDRGDAWMALAIPAGYGERLGAGRPQTVQVIADGSDSNSATVALGYATSLVAGYAQQLLAARQPAAASAGLDPRIRIWFNPDLDSRLFMVPGVLALLLLVVTAILSSMAIVREREMGTLEQLNVTPLGRAELIAGKLVPYAAIGLLDATLAIAIAIFWFEVPLRGSLLLLAGLTIVYLLTTLGLGLFVSTISSTQQQAMMTAMFFFLMPMIYLSGFVFPIANMPAALQPFAYAIPLSYYLVIVRGIFLKGIGLSAIWPQAVALTAWGLGILALAAARSRKRIG